MWLLYLNPIHSDMKGKTNAKIVARAESKEALIRFMENEKVDMYIERLSMGKMEIYKEESDHEVTEEFKEVMKWFRKDGPLEWYALPGTDSTWHVFQNIGTLESQIQKTQDLWNSIVDCVLVVDQS